MKKSINLYFNKDKNAKRKLQKIKEAGFDEFFCGIYDEYDDLSLSQLCEFAKSLGLKCTMIHCRYDEPNLHYFWEDGELGEQICNDYCEQIKTAAGLTENFVVHLNADKKQQQSQIGLLRINKMLNVCNEANINLCVENLYSISEIEYIFSNIKHKRLKICFDAGHHNYLTPEFDLLSKYSQFVEVLHLHDNHQKTDEHLICGQGTVNWQTFAKQIKCLSNIVLSAEIKSQGDTTSALLNEVYDSLCYIENLINN